MNASNESQARWHATKLILVYLSIMGVLGGMAYINVLYMLTAILLFFVFAVAGAIYQDAYYSKLMELESNDQSRTN